MTKVLPHTEYDLARAIIRGETIAQRTFYAMYSARFLGICCRYIADKMAAEDIMVESMMRIFEKCHRFDFQGSFEGWCKRLVVNEALGYLRKQKMTIVSWEEDYPISESVNLETEDILRIIHELPVGYRTVFNLYAIEGYSHAEIAEMLAISEGTSKSQLSRARSLLQAQLKKNETLSC